MQSNISKKTGAKMIAEMKSFDFIMKPEIILVYLGLKPVCVVTVDEFDDIDEIKITMKRLKLSFVEKENFNNKWYEDLEKKVGEKLVKPYAEYSISKELNLAKKHSSAKDNPVDHYQYGRLMGYPESAVKAFVEKKPMLSQGVIHKLMHKKGFVFIFAIPEEDPEESLVFLENWSKAIKKYAPVLYNELLSFHSKNCFKKN